MGALLDFTLLIKSGVRKGDFLYSSYLITQPHYLTNEENQGSVMQRENHQLSPFQVPENVLEGLCMPSHSPAPVEVDVIPPPHFIDG